MSEQADLFAALVPPCGSCPNFGEPINSGVAYCHAQCLWRGPDERVEGCDRYGVAVPRFTPPSGTRSQALRDLLESPRHSISEKDRKWLRAELRREERGELAA